jgi:hypothetical protein
VGYASSATEGLVYAFNKDVLLGTLLCVPSLASAVILGSRPILIRLITLAANCAGARSAVNPHAACDVADVGDGVTEHPKRARSGKPRLRAKDDLTGYAPASDPTSGIRDSVEVHGLTYLYNSHRRLPEFPDIIAASELVLTGDGDREYFRTEEGGFK